MMNEREQMVATMRALRAAPFAMAEASVEFEENIFEPRDDCLWTCGRPNEIYRDHMLARLIAAFKIHGKSYTIKSFVPARIDRMEKLVTEYLEWKRVSCSPNPEENGEAYAACAAVREELRCSETALDAMMKAPPRPRQSLDVDHKV
jgi:hypothetical protein